MLPSDFKHYTQESQPLVIDPETASKIGLNEAIILRQIHYWLQINEKFDEKNCKNNHTHESRVYSYNTFGEWQSQFPFWSQPTIKRIFYNLKKLNLIEIITNPKNSWDKTNWYTINYDIYANLYGSHFQKCDDRSYQNDTMERINLIRCNKDSETTTETNAEKRDSIRQSPTEPGSFYKNGDPLPSPPSSLTDCRHPLSPSSSPSEIKEILKSNVSTDFLGCDPRTVATQSVSTEQGADPGFGLDLCFEDAWKLYPNTSGKSMAKKKYLQLVKKQPKLIELIHNQCELSKKINDFTKTPEFKERGGFIPFPKHMATWLNQECYNEDLLENVKNYASQNNKGLPEYIDRFFGGAEVAQAEQPASQPEQSPISRSEYMNLLNNQFKQ